MIWVDEHNRLAKEFERFSDDVIKTDEVSTSDVITNYNCIIDFIRQVISLKLKLRK
jgi:hypothetical protein